MATSPTVLADSPLLPTAPGQAPDPKSGIPFIPLLLTVIVGMLIAALAVGGMLFYLMRSGRLPTSNAFTKSEKLEQPSAHVLVLDPLLVNLSDPSGTSYLRVALTLRVVDTKKLETKKKDPGQEEEKPDGEMVAALRDTILTVLGRQTTDALLAPDGKERLKADLKAALQAHNADAKVNEIFITDYLVQR